MNTLELDTRLNALIIERKSREAVAVRRWKNGGVVRERFYHK